MAPMMIVTQDMVWFEDGKREIEKERDRERKMRKEKREKDLCTEDILTVCSPPPALHTSGTE